MKTIINKFLLAGAALCMMSFSSCAFFLLDSHGFDSETSSTSSSTALYYQTEMGTISRYNYDRYIRDCYSPDYNSYYENNYMLNTCRNNTTVSISKNSCNSIYDVQSFLYTYCNSYDVSGYVTRIKSGGNIILFFESSEPGIYVWYYVKQNSPC